MLEDREAKTAELRRLIQEGLDSGPPVPFDADRLRAKVLARAGELRDEP